MTKNELLTFEAVLKRPQIIAQTLGDIMKKGLYLILLCALFYQCSIKEKALIQTVEHSPIDTVVNYTFKDFTLHSWLPDSLPKHAGSEIWISSSDTTLYKRMKFQAIGAKVIPYLRNESKVIVEPISDSVLLSIYKDSSLISVKKFISPRLPKPVLEIYDGRNQRISKIPINADSIRISFNQANPKLKRIYPMDLRYFGKYWILNTTTNKSIKGTIGKSLNIYDLVKNMKSGEVVLLSVDSLYRRNYRNNAYLIGTKLDYELTVE